MNFIERIINIVVNNRKANTDLKNTEKSLQNVDTQTKNLDKSQKGLTDTVTKNGGAMKILNGLTGGLAGSFKDAYDASKLFVNGLNGIRGAIAATGIGALVVGVGLLIQNWETFSNLLSRTNEEEKLGNEARKNQISQNINSLVQAGNLIRIISNESNDLNQRLLALDKLTKIIPEISGLDITNEEDLKRIQLIGVQYSEILKDLEKQAPLEAKLKKLADEKAEAVIKSQEAQEVFNKEIEKIEKTRGTFGFNQRLELELRVKAAKELNKVLEEEKNINDKIGKTQKEIESIEASILKKRGESKSIQDDSLQRILEEAAARAKAEADRAEAVAKEAKRLADLQNLIDSFRKRNEDLDADSAMKKIELEEERALADLARLKGTEEQKKEIELFYARLKAEELKKIRVEQEQEEIALNERINETLRLQTESFLMLEQIRFDAQMQQWEQYWEDVILISETSQGFLQTLQDESLIRSKDLRNAFLVLEKGFAIANVWINETLSSNQIKLNAASVPDFVYLPNGVTTPNPAKPIALASAARSVTANKINAGIATATILAQTVASWNRGGGGNAGGGQGGQGAPQFNVVEASGTNQLAATIAAQQQQPINAYVVGSDVATQLALDRNRITNSTFLFWVPFIFMANFLIFI
jgi:hypothetical protein